MPNDVQGQVAASTGVPVMPRVNLMPPEIAEAAKFRRFQLAMGATVVAAVGIVAALYMSAHGGIASAQSDFDSAQQQHVALQAQATKLQSVQAVYDQVAARQQMLSQAMGDEIRWSAYLNDLSLRIPDNVWLTDVEATEQTTTGSSSTSTVPTTTTGTTTPGSLGTITFTGIAFTHNDVAAFLDSLAREKGYTNAYFSNSTESTIGTRPIVNFTSSVDLDSDALSGRYVKPAGS